MNFNPIGTVSIFVGETRGIDGEEFGDDGRSEKGGHQRDEEERSEEMDHGERSRVTLIRKN